MSKRRKEMAEYDKESHAVERKRKNLALFLTLIIIMAGIGAASAYWLISGSESGSIKGTGSGGSTGTISGTATVKGHNVIGELFVTTTCPYCAKAEEDLRTIEDARSDFYFVTFVADVNQDAYNRYMEISKRQGTPDTEFDGGRRGELGAVNTSKYIEGINYCKNVDVSSIDISGSARIESSGISFSVRVSVNSGTFSGHIRAFVIEKVSRYNNVKNEPIPNAFIGYALNTDFSTSSVNPYSKTGTWNGVVGDPGNMAIIVAVYDGGGYGVQTYRINL